MRPKITGRSGLAACAAVAAVLAAGAALAQTPPAATTQMPTAATSAVVGEPQRQVYLPSNTGSGGDADAIWPCQQRKVPVLSPAQVWQGPDIEATGAVPRSTAMRRLVEDVAARRTPLDEAEKQATDFVAALPADMRQAAGTAVFSDLFDRLTAERSEVMRGIERYGAKQTALADKLRQENAALDALRRAGDTPPQTVDAAEQQFLWDSRIFDERRQSLSSVCEVPTLIEQRLFALGRAIGGAL
ncbi:hypothetical protein NPA31_011600 [Aurantimonas sp. MSK8Z-1]|uniref:hypothetical protein n=1 Tax=Mangrovibrevibacter kandeliae TaxID=2968473 RepID=UPI0021198605|nr:hypothetical protein [Aurantimonas sp. MSK8Z-1]MCW4115608.1 hypothetical protein [Aurantimonas sp. MSK8Z-1]